MGISIIPDMDRNEYYTKVNRKAPVVSLRLPSRGHLERLQEAAEKEGQTVSEWLRTAAAERLATQS